MMKNKERMMVLLLMAATLLTGCRGSSDGQDAAAEDAGKQMSNFYITNTDAQDYSKQRKKQRTNKSGKLLEMPATRKGSGELILYKKAYTISYNPTTKIPNWVAWHLTASHANGHAQRHRDMFREDPEAPQPRVTDEDYYNSGFDRGHMCPAGDNKWSDEAMRETFYFTNMCPQVHRLNTGPWNDLEIACRRWAQKYGDIYIVCGPILENRQHRTIGRRKVVVPERFFKVVLCMNDKPKAIGFVYENSGHNSEKMFSHATTVDEVERITGLDFFPQLDDKTETKVEAERGYF